MKQNAMDLAAEKGEIAELDKCLATSEADRISPNYTTDAVDFASANGHVSVLNWFWDNGLELKYTSAAADWAAENGHASVLEWFKRKPKTLTFSKKDIVDLASTDGHIDVLNWLKVNVPFVFDQDIIDEWDIIDLASWRGDVALLDWWKRSGFHFTYTTNALDWAASKGHIAVLEWFTSHGLELKCTTNFLSIDNSEVQAWYQRNKENINLELDRFAWAGGVPRHAYIFDVFKKHQTNVENAKL